MKLDDKYSLLSSTVLDSFKEMFGKEVVLTEKTIVPEHMGYFKIVYKYIPLNYKFVFESDRDLFSIVIYDNEEAKSPLDGKYDNETIEKKYKECSFNIKTHNR